MAGLWDRINRPGNGGENDPTLVATDVCDTLWQVRLGNITPAQAITVLNGVLNAPLDAHAQQDLIDMDTYISQGTGETGQVARWTRICQELASQERNIHSIDEATSRSNTGVTYTF